MNTRLTHIAGRSMSGTFAVVSRGTLHLLGLVLALSVVTSAQNSSSTTDGQTPLGMAAGAPAGSYPLSGFESVNPYNGALNFRLPLLQIGGRGSVQHVVTLAVEQHWRVDKLKTSGVVYKYDPNPNRWTTFDPGFGPGTLIGRRTGLSQAQGIEVYCPDNGIAVTRLTFTAPDGTEFELRDANTQGAQMDNVYSFVDQFNCQLLSTHWRGRVFVTADGSAATFISDIDINDHGESDAQFSLPQPQFFPSGYLFMRDGTCQRIDGGKVRWIRDRNGNRMTFDYGPENGPRVLSITDSLNRVVTLAYDLHDTPLNKDYDLISYKGFGGANRNIKIWYSKLANRLRDDFAPPAGGGVKSREFLFAALDASDLSSYNPRIVSEIELPDTRQYLLKYNYFGELAQVDLPTGGRIEYDYDAGVTGLTGDFVNGVINVSQNKAIYRRCVQRRVYSDAGATLELKENYSRPETLTTNQGFVEVIHRDGSTNVLARDRHFYFGSPRDSYSIPPYGYPSWKDGREYKTEFYDKGGNGALLRTVENTFEQRPLSGWWGSNIPDDSAPPLDTRLTRVQTTLNDSGQVSKQEFDYDAFNNRTEVREYDFGGATPVRKTQTTYLTTNLGANYTTVNPNTINPDPHATVHIRSLPLQESVYDNTQTEKARTTYEYDNYTAALLGRPLITGHATTALPTEPASHSTTYLTRGNCTALTKWILGSPTIGRLTRMQYDIAGNALSVTDPRNKTTSFEFEDRFGIPDMEARTNLPPAELAGGLKTHAFATKVTNHLQQNSYSQYDYYLGKPVNSEDPNGLVAKGVYGDALDRPTDLVVNIIAGTPPTTTFQKRTTFSYNDAAKIVTTQSDQTTYNDGIFKTEVSYDGLGRTTDTRSYEDGPTFSQYILTKQNYDGLGRPIKVSNPYRPNSNPAEPLLWTTTTYDGLGRVLTVTTPDSAVATTTYSGNATTARDQALKQRRSVTDALGRLKQVDELFESGTLYATTSYAYDTLNNLVQVTQGSQQRFFRYDSLSRLIRARNPEQDINTDLALTDGSQWCMGYSYDENGNLQTRTDARKITTTYGYDDLNRPKTRTYAAPAGVPATDPVTFYYDNAQTLPPGVPSFATGASVGRLVAVLYGGGSSTTGNYTGYDAVGRPIVSFQKTDSSVYRMDYGYDLSGEMISETYPGTAGTNRRVVRTEYDAAGRIAGIRNGATGPYYAGDATNRIAYTSHGAVSKMKLGNGLWEHTDFNSRLQPTQIGLGTAASGAGSTSMLGLDYTYGVMAGAVLDTTKNNGNIESQTINAGGLILKQSYTYDQVNRLLTAEEIRSGAQPPQQWKQAFMYDRFGNRNFDLPNTTGNVIGPNSNPSIDPATNRFQGSSYGYDTAGNLTSDPTTNPNAILYDGENRQTRYTRNGTTEYFYDGDGRRVKKVDSSTTVFVYDVSGHLVAEYTTALPSGPGGTSYLTTDHLGSTRVVTTAGPSPTVKARYDYLPFGEQIASTIGNRGSVAGYLPNDSTRQKFTGYERDTESGLDFAEARYCSSTYGRFTSPDSVFGSPANPQTLNLYVYVSNNPLALVDPTGHMGGGPPLTGLAFPSSDAYQTYLSDPTLTFAYLGLLPVLVEQIGIQAPLDQITPQMGRLQLLNNMLAGTADTLSDAVLPVNGLIRHGLNSLVDAQAGLGIDTSSDGYRAGNELIGPMLATAIGVAAGGVGSLEGAAETASAEVAGRVPEGLFSVWDWTGYPSGYPQPTGPFRLIQGAEYSAAREAANQVNGAIRNANPFLKALEFDVHEVTPVKFGGSPTSMSNKIFVPREIHQKEITPFWNMILRAVN